jgi:hypothetical protein
MNPYKLNRYTRTKYNRNNNYLYRGILKEYDSLPYKGPSFVIPGGEIVSNDTWRDSLIMRLDEIEFDFYELQDFNLNNFLKEKINLEGTEKQKRDFADKNSYKILKTICSLTRKIIRKLKSMI